MSSYYYDTHVYQSQLTYYLQRIITLLEPISEGFKNKIFNADIDVDTARIKAILKTPITEIQIDTRTKNALRLAGIVFLGDLAAQRRPLVEQLKRIGHTAMVSLDKELNRFGLKWQMNVEQYGYDALRIKRTYPGGVEYENDTLVRYEHTI